MMNVRIVFVFALLGLAEPTCLERGGWDRNGTALGNERSVTVVDAHVVGGELTR